MNLQGRIELLVLDDDRHRYVLVENLGSFLIQLAASPKNGLTKVAASSFLASAVVILKVIDLLRDNWRIVQDEIQHAQT